MPVYEPEPEIGMSASRKDAKVQGPTRSLSKIKSEGLINWKLLSGNQPVTWIKCIESTRLSDKKDPIDNVRSFSSMTT